MNPERIPLQHDMFTGDRVDNRTANQKQAEKLATEPKQTEMFKLREVIQPGVRIKPMVDLSTLPRPPLVLVSEDTRTDEEKEADLNREAEANTYKLFANDLDLDELQPTENDQHDPVEKIDQLPDNVPRSAKYNAYRTLINVAREQVTTLWLDNTYQSRFQQQLPLTIVSAHQAGLSPDEINLAVQIGTILGEEEKQKSPPNPTDVHTIYQEPPLRHRPMGLRTRHRQQTIPVRQANRSMKNTESITPPDKLHDMTALSQSETIPVISLQWDDLYRIPLSESEIAALDSTDLATIAQHIRQRYLAQHFWHDLKICAEATLNTKGIPIETCQFVNAQELARLPLFYDGEPVNVDTLAPFKFHLADDDRSWYPIAFDQEDTFIGLIVTDEIEMGTFSLNDLQHQRGRLGLPVGQDPDYIPKTVQSLWDNLSDQLGIHSTIY